MVVMTDRHTRASLKSVLVSGISSLVVAALIAVPTFFAAILVSFSSGGTEWVVYVLALAVGIGVSSRSLVTSLHRASIEISGPFALVAASVLGVILIGIGYGVVSLVGVVVGPGFFLMVAAELAGVVGWALCVQRWLNRQP